MLPPPRLLPVALIVAGLTGFQAFAEETPAAKAAPVAAEEGVPAKTPEAAEAAPVKADDAKAKPGSGDDAAKSGDAPKPAEPKKLSPEEAAKAEARRKIDRMTLEKLRIDTELEIAALKLRKSRDAEIAERARIDAEASLRAAKLAAEGADDDEARAEAERRLALADAKARLEQVEVANRARVLETDLKLLRQELDNNVARIGAEAAKRRREQEADKVLNVKRDYRAEPFVDGRLYVSDRRIPLNGPIVSGVAEQIIDRINFFNRRDPAAPIFIVIDNSPGGSIMGGYQILKAIQSSPAPVHVVVRGAAESMTAVIVALAPHSYCFERSVIVHHQSDGKPAGKAPYIRDTLREMERWSRRINGPVAAKMGLSLEDFVKTMYQKNAQGDWSEFGEDAVKLKWVDHVVTGLVDESIDSLAEVPSKPMVITMGGNAGLVERTDTEGRSYFELPPLAPGDAWMLAGPEGLYRSR